MSAALDLRAPHRATRLVVEAEGDAAPRDLYVYFDELNVEHYAGKLGAPLILVTPASSLRAFGDYCSRDVHGLQSRIRIAPRVPELGIELRFARDVLLHESVHAWQYEIGDAAEPGYRGHGPKFAGKCNEIGERLGLPPVGVKGRGGLPNCAQWPHCVRPPGFYGSADLDVKEPGDGNDGRATTGADARAEIAAVALEIMSHIDEGNSGAARMVASLLHEACRD